MKLSLLVQAVLNLPNFRKHYGNRLADELEAALVQPAQPKSYCQAAHVWHKGIMQPCGYCDPVLTKQAQPECNHRMIMSGDRRGERDCLSNCSGPQPCSLTHNPRGQTACMECGVSVPYEKHTCRPKYCSNADCVYCNG